ncbi:aspartyl-phosphate phosphatase Spo0E family protein [Chungangia koreensis]|uniref:Aspartyl-phosphate phosphatase Spo0E family protein n=1 Tax=Chungangia koreensis TaxID=752657 RepID=A0ABV8X276_9LACT
MKGTLLKDIEDTRAEMIETALEKGISNAETIRLSKQLDHLLNMYNLSTRLKQTQKKYKLRK